MKTPIETLHKQLRNSHRDREDCFFLDACTEAGSTSDLHELHIDANTARPLADVHHGLACLGAMASVLSGLMVEEDTGDRVGVSRFTHGTLLDGMAVFSSLLQDRVKDIGKQIERMERVQEASK